MIYHKKKLNLTIAQVNDLGGNFNGEGCSKKQADVVVAEIRAMGGQGTIFEFNRNTI